MPPKSVCHSDTQHAEKGNKSLAVQIGLQTRYESTRDIAPYIDVQYRQAFGETSAMLRRGGAHSKAVIYGVGLQVMF